MKVVHVLQLDHSVQLPTDSGFADREFQTETFTLVMELGQLLNHCLRKFNFWLFLEVERLALVNVIQLLAIFGCGGVKVEAVVRGSSCWRVDRVENIG